MIDTTCHSLSLFGVRWSNLYKRIAWNSIQKTFALRSPNEWFIPWHSVLACIALAQNMWTLSNQQFWVHVSVIYVHVQSSTLFISTQVHLHATGTYCQNNESSCSQDSYSAPKSKGSSGLDTMWVGVGFCFNDRMLITRVVGWRPSFFLEVPFLWHGSVCWVMVLLFLRQSCKMRHVSWGIVARVFDLGFFDQCYCTSSVPPTCRTKQNTRVNHQRSLQAYPSTETANVNQATADILKHFPPHHVHYVTAVEAKVGRMMTGAMRRSCPYTEKNCDAR